MDVPPPIFIALLLKKFYYLLLNFYTQLSIIITPFWIDKISRPTFDLEDLGTVARQDLFMVGIQKETLDRWPPCPPWPLTQEQSYLCDQGDWNHWSYYSMLSIHQEVWHHICQALGRQLPPAAPTIHTFWRRLRSLWTSQQPAASSSKALTPSPSRLYRRQSERKGMLDASKMRPPRWSHSCYRWSRQRRILGFRQGRMASLELLFRRRGLIVTFKM